MYPGKENLFLRKWEGFVPKLLKVAALEHDSSVPVPPDEENDGKLYLPCMRK